MSTRDENQRTDVPALIEDAVPDSGETVRVVETLSEVALRPGTERVFRTAFNKDKHNANTQRTLAVGAVGVLVVFYGSTFVGFWVEAFTMEEVTGLIAAFSVVQTLAAAVFGYYFAKEA